MEDYSGPLALSTPGCAADGSSDERRWAYSKTISDEHAADGNRERTRATVVLEAPNESLSCPYEGGPKKVVQLIHHAALHVGQDMRVAIHRDHNATVTE